MKALLRTVFLLLSAVLIASLSEAQSSQVSDSDRIQQLLQRIDLLEASQKAMQEKIDSLQAPKPAAEPAPEPTPEPAAEQPQSHVLGPVEFHGFSDFDYGNAWFEKLPPGGLKGSTKSFNIGDFDLYNNTRLSDRWSMLGEMLVSSDFSNEFGVEMDRLLLTYKRNQYFKVSFGKYATSLGYYTNEFHRAQYFQTGVGRRINAATRWLSPLCSGSEETNLLFGLKPWAIPATPCASRGGSRPRQPCPSPSKVGRFAPQSALASP